MEAQTQRGSHVRNPMSGGMIAVGVKNNRKAKQVYRCVIWGRGVKRWKGGSKKKDRGANETYNSQEPIRTTTPHPGAQPRPPGAVPAGRGQQLGGRSRARAALRGYLILSVGRRTRTHHYRSRTLRPRVQLGLGCRPWVCAGPPARGRRAEGAPWVSGGGGNALSAGPGTRVGGAPDAPHQRPSPLGAPRAALRAPEASSADTALAPARSASGATTRARHPPRCAPGRRRPCRSEAGPALRAPRGRGAGPGSGRRGLRRQRAGRGSVPAAGLSPAALDRGRRANWPRGAGGGLYVNRGCARAS